MRNVQKTSSLAHDSLTSSATRAIDIIGTQGALFRSFKVPFPTRRVSPGPTELWEAAKIKKISPGVIGSSATVAPSIHCVEGDTGSSERRL